MRLAVVFNSNEVAILRIFPEAKRVTSQKDDTGREDFPTYDKKRKDVGWEIFPTENVFEKLPKLAVNNSP